jgi:hypothetical protein
LPPTNGSNMDGHATKWGIFNAHFWGAFTARS